MTYCRLFMPYDIYVTYYTMGISDWPRVLARVLLKHIVRLGYNIELDTRYDDDLKR